MKFSLSATAKNAANQNLWIVPPNLTVHSSPAVSVGWKHFCSWPALKVTYLHFFKGIELICPSTRIQENGLHLCYEEKVEAQSFLDYFYLKQKKISIYLKVLKTDFVFPLSLTRRPLSSLAGMGGLTDFFCTSMRNVRGSCQIIGGCLACLLTFTLKIIPVAPLIVINEFKVHKLKSVSNCYLYSLCQINYYSSELPFIKIREIAYP